MEDTTQTTEQSQPDVDPMDALDADVSQMLSGQEAPQEVATEPEGQQPTDAPQSWEQKHVELETQVSKERQEVRQWFGTHFNDRAKYEAFAEWSKSYESGGVAQPAAPDVEPAAESDLEADDEDIFATVDQNKAKMAHMERQLADMQRTSQIQTQQQIITQTEEEAVALGEKYPAVATPQGRTMMMQIALATIDNGGTMEHAAKKIQALTGNIPQAESPAQPVAQVIPTAISGGGSGRSAAVVEGDAREANWFSANNIDSMELFDIIAADTRKDFGIRH